MLLSKEYNQCIEICEKALVADVEGKHQSELQGLIYKCRVAVNSVTSEKDKEEMARKAMNDPEVQVKEP